jgi:hypothetical protein
MNWTRSTLDRRNELHVLYIGEKFRKRPLEDDGKRREDNIKMIILTSYIEMA